ncbi:MAG: helix-turn-helix transcriptional regulator [Gemmatimonadetes bacterium]|nr:helix-turn-helix transcriptional regulator [Gemmatimonadota bacterium]MYF63800.1 helix-turn-helix transcriptional regulator [Rhodothermaceae bacterium]MYK53487.1 helix-turn-helix transcriptional regulator [Gemmatimonadota bacterium]
MERKKLAKPSEVFKDRLRSARENLRQMTQVDLARAIGLPPSSIAHFESGNRKPSFDNLHKIANALNVTTDYLVGRADDPNTTASADPIYRHVANLTDQNRRTAEDFLRFLAEQDRRQREGDHQ